MSEGELYMAIAEELELIPEDLDDLLVEELKAIAKALGITGYSNMNKQDLIEAIELAIETP